MPASQSSGVGSKKPRKKARPPQQISNETWRGVEAAICIGGLGYSEAGRKFGIEPHAIMGKAKRNNWPLPSKIAERAAVLQSRYNRNGNEEVIEAAATSWAEKGEMHRALAFILANGALAAAARTGGLPIESWRDAHLADQVAREIMQPRSREHSGQYQYGPRDRPPGGRLPFFAERRPSRHAGIRISVADGLFESPLSKS